MYPRPSERSNRFPGSLSWEGTDPRIQPHCLGSVALDTHRQDQKGTGGGTEPQGRCQRRRSEEVACKLRAE